MKKGKSTSAKARKAEAVSLPVDLEAARERLLTGGSLSDGELLQLLGTDTPCTGLYDKACKCRKDSPNCLAGLIPAPGAYRRKGLWQKDPQAVAALGPDPAAQQRQDASAPGGLANLGNTCYVNSALQCLFMNAAFRRGLFAVEEPLAQQPVLSHLRRLFADLAAGPRATANPTEFAQVLNLDNTVQQDGQEFLKLLLSLLESKLALSSQPAVQMLVPTLFRGSYVYETICEACGRASEGSSRVTDFYELDLPVQGLPDLPASLASVLATEHLRGDNRFHCTACNAKQDATRRMCLRSLPPFLCLALQRFVFDLRKFAKVKVTDKFRFPLELDLAALLPPGQPGSPGARVAAGGAVYDLVAILIHKGSSASHGHYVAHVRSEEDGGWWRFDDEAVTRMEAGPASAPGDHGVASASAAAARKAAGGKGKGKKGKKGKKAETEDELSELEEDMIVGGAGGVALAALEQEDAAKHITSSNAYMLAYRRRGWQPPSMPGGDEALPPSIQKLIQEENETFADSCRSYKETQAASVARVRERQELVRATLEAAPLASLDEPCRFVAADWLREWADSEASPAPLDNSLLLCAHHMLDPNKAAGMKRISVAAWQQLAGSAGGEPELAPSDLCRQCLMSNMEHAAAAQEVSQERDEALAVLASLPEEGPASRDAFLVSKSWLMAWRKRSGRSMGATSPTEGITCRHGSLAPEGAGGVRARRAHVPPAVWDFLRRAWLQERQQHSQKGVETITLDSDDAAETAQPAANGHHRSADSGCTLAEFPAAQASTCAVCMQEQALGAEAGQEARGRAESERAALPHLASGTAAAWLDPAASYHLLPRQWLLAWRAFVASATKRGGASTVAAAAAPPPPLGPAVEELLCTCHEGPARGLDAPLPRLAERRGKWVVEDPANEAVDLVDAPTWRVLLALYGPGGANSGPDGPSCPSITATMEVDAQPLAPASPVAEGALADEVVLGDDLKPLTAARPRRLARLLTTPPVCLEALQRKEAHLRAAALAYRGAEVMVEVVRSTDFLTEDSGAAHVERKSKRARRGRAPVLVNANDTVYDLRLKIFQSVGVHPLNAQIYVRRQRLQDDSATLAECEVYPDEEIRVLNTEQYDDNDVSALFDASGSVRTRREVEFGFSGTALMGAAPLAMAGTAAAHSGARGAAPCAADCSRLDNPAAGGDDEGVERGSQAQRGSAAACSAAAEAPEAPALAAQQRQSAREQPAAAAAATDRKRRPRARRRVPDGAEEEEAADMVVDIMS